VDQSLLVLMSTNHQENHQTTNQNHQIQKQEDHQPKAQNLLIQELPQNLQLKNKINRDKVKNLKPTSQRIKNHNLDQHLKISLPKIIKKKQLTANPNLNPNLNHL